MDLSWLPSDVVRKLQPSLRFFVGFVPDGARSRINELEASGRAALEQPYPGRVSASRATGGWSGVARTSVPKGWRVLGEEDSPAKMVLFFILQQKLDILKDGIFFAEPITKKCKYQSLLET